METGYYSNAAPLQSSDLYIIREMKRGVLYIHKGACCEGVKGGTGGQKIQRSFERRVS